MHYYILDQNTQPMEKFEKLQTELSGLLAEFKVSGEATRVTPLRSVQDLVDTASQRGATTLVAFAPSTFFFIFTLTGIILTPRVGASPTNAGVAQR